MSRLTLQEHANFLLVVSQQAGATHTARVLNLLATQCTWNTFLSPEDGL